MGVADSSCQLTDIEAQKSGKVQLFVAACGSGGGGGCTPKICASAAKEESLHLRTANSAFHHLQAGGGLPQHQLPPEERLAVERAADEWCAALSAPGGRRLVVNGSEGEVTLSTRPLALVVEKLGTFPVSFVEEISLTVAACWGGSGSDCILTFGPNPWGADNAGLGPKTASGWAEAASGSGGGRSQLCFSFALASERITFVLAVRVLQLLVPELQGAAGLGQRPEADDAMSIGSRGSRGSRGKKPRGSKAGGSKAGKESGGGKDKESGRSKESGRGKEPGRMQRTATDEGSVAGSAPGSAANSAANSAVSSSSRRSRGRPAPLSIFPGLAAPAKAQDSKAVPPDRTSPPQEAAERKKAQRGLRQASEAEDSDGINLQDLMDDEDFRVKATDSPSAKAARKLLQNAEGADPEGADSDQESPDSEAAAWRSLEFRRPDDSPSVRAMKKKSTSNNTSAHDSDEEPGSNSQKAAAREKAAAAQERAAAQEKAVAQALEEAAVLLALSEAKPKPKPKPEPEQAEPKSEAEALPDQREGWRRFHELRREKMKELIGGTGAAADRPQP